MDISLKMIYKWSISIWRDVQHHWSSGMNENQWDITSHVISIATNEKQKVINVGKVIKKLELLHTLCRNAKCTVTAESKQLCKILNAELPHDPAILFLSPKYLKAEAWRDICMSTFTAALFTIKEQKSLKCCLIASNLKKRRKSHHLL